MFIFLGKINKMEKIQFKNRNGDDITFEKVGDNTYKFYSSFNYGMRMGYKDDTMLS